MACDLDDSAAEADRVSVEFVVDQRDLRLRLWGYGDECHGCLLLPAASAGLRERVGSYATAVRDRFPSQIDVTTWPGIRLPIPESARVECRLDVAEGVIVPCPRGRFGYDWHEQMVALDGETYLRLAAVDLDDPEAIFAFVAKYGPLGGEELYRTFMDAVVGQWVFMNLYGPQLNPRVEEGRKVRALLREEAAQMTNVAERDIDSKLRANFPSYALRLVYTETLDEFRFAARCLRDLTSAWRMFREGTAVSEMHWVSPLQPEPGVSRGFSATTDSRSTCSIGCYPTSS